MYSQRPYSALPYSSVESLPVVGGPFGQTDWPNPTPAPRRTIALLTWTDAFKLPLQQVLPLNQDDWPNPPLAARRNPQDWQDWFKLPLQQTLPENQSDWPNPRGPLRAIDLLTWIVPPTVMASVPPQIPNVMNYDWPNPRAPLRSVDLLTWTQAISTTALALVLSQKLNQHDWPNPPLARRRNPQDWIQQALSTIRIPAPTPPMRSRDWPVPRGPRRSVSLLTNINHTPLFGPASSGPRETLANETGRVRFLNNEEVRVRFLAKNLDL